MNPNLTNVRSSTAVIYNNSCQPITNCSLHQNLPNLTSNKWNAITVCFRFLPLLLLVMKMNVGGVHTGDWWSGDNSLLQIFCNLRTSQHHHHITRPCTLASAAIAKLAKQKGNIPGWNGPMLHSAKCPAAVVSTVSGAIVHRHHSDRVAGKPLFACKIFLPSRSTLDISSWDCRLINCLGGGDGRWEIITGPKCEMRVLLMLKAEHSEENCCCCGVGEQLPATAVLL